MNVKPFSQSIPLIRDGATDLEVGRKLREVIAAVEATQGKGELILSLKVSMADKNSTMVKIDPVITAKMPKEEVASSILFVDRNHEVTRERPRESREELPGNVEKIDRKVGS